MVFSAMAEELGFLRLLIVLFMYSLLVVRGYKIAQEAPDRFGFMVATGITTWIAFQTLVNIAVNVSLFPLTGLTLPFISYGDRRWCRCSRASAFSSIFPCIRRRRRALRGGREKTKWDSKTVCLRRNFRRLPNSIATIHT